MSNGIDVYGGKRGTEPSTARQADRMGNVFLVEAVLGTHLLYSNSVDNDGFE